MKKWRDSKFCIAFHFHFVRLSRVYAYIFVFFSVAYYSYMTIFLYKKNINEAKRKNEANKSVCAMLLFVCSFLCSYIRIFFLLFETEPSFLSFALFAFNVVKRRHVVRELEMVRLQCGRCNHFFGTTNRLKLFDVF